MKNTKRAAKKPFSLTLAYGKTMNGYFGFIKELPGVVSQGRDKEELSKNINDAIIAMFEANRAEIEEKNKDIDHHSISEEAFCPTT